MKRYFLLSLAVVLLSSCGIDPEKEYNAILNQTTKELNELQAKISNLDSYEITTKLNDLYSQYDEKVNVLQVKLEDNDKKSKILSEITQVFSDIDAYKDAVKSLTDKNIAIFKEIQGVKWINVDTNNPESIFYIDAKKIGFVNLSKEFSYSISDGNFSFNYGIVYFNIDNDELEIKDDFGNVAKYRKAVDQELLLGKWKNPNTYGGKWGGYGMVLQSNGKSAEFGESWQNTSYTISQGNRITTTWKESWGYVNTNYYIYDQKSDKLNPCNQNWQILSGIVKYVRVKNSGPQSIEFIFTGNKESSEEQLPDIQTSKPGGSNDWDAVLDSYEKYVNDYITYAKKVAKGDVGAISKLGTLLEDAEEFGDKLENAEDDLSSSQLSRYMKITTKFTEAMADLSR